MAKNIANLNENGPFTVVDMGNNQNALLVTQNPNGIVNSERLSNQFVAGTKSASGDNTNVIATPGAGYQIIIEGFSLQNETTTSQTIQIKNGSGTVLWRVRAPNDGDGVAMSNLRWALGANQSLTLNLSAAAQIGYSFAYHTEAV